MFVGRERELQKLSSMYNSSQFEFAVFYGRKRVGKTTLINEFCRDKKSIYFVATEMTDAENLKQLSKAVLQRELLEGGSPSFGGFEDLFSYIDTISMEERLILVIGEYPYLAESYRGISSLLQAHIEQSWQRSKVFLILCGSSMSFMERQILGYRSPLYGRRTAQFKIHPFTFFESRKMVPFFLRKSRLLHMVLPAVFQNI